MIDLSPRRTTPDDLPGIFRLYRKHLAREPNESRIALHVSQFPSAVVESTTDDLLGFAYTVDFAPDVLELANILIDNGARDKGLGSTLVAEIERQASARFSGIIVVNSMLYTSAEEKRPATRFYERLGYGVVASTRFTNLFYKRID